MFYTSTGTIKICSILCGIWLIICYYKWLRLYHRNILTMTVLELGACSAPPPKSDRPRLVPPLPQSEPGTVVGCTDFASDYK